MYKIRWVLLWLFLVNTFLTSGQTTTGIASRNASPLQSGPMVGYSDMREVMLWAQTKQPARVQIRYHEAGKPTPAHLTNEVKTNRNAAFTAHLLADQVEPGKKYEYEVLIEGRKVSLPYPTTFQTQNLWQWRTDPPAFRFGVGSCTYVGEGEYDRPGTPYGGGYEIFTALAAQKPDFMLWTGDNTYTREADWNSRTGVLKRYTHTRSLPEMQPLLAAAHNYAIWDDHDYGPDDSDRSYWLKTTTLDAFKLFWANPNFIFDEGCTGTFFWNDCQFFLLDDRTFRAPDATPDGPEKVYFGEKQRQWLIDALRFSKATFKFIITGGQIVNPAKIFENYAIYGTERDKLFNEIADAKIPGVLFITGDRHHTILHKLARTNGQPGSTYPLYDLTISPLTSGPSKPLADELKQPTYVEGTLVTDRNFGILSVSGPLKDRVLTIQVFDQKGAERWSRELRANDLK
ncbi:alkaline phosphatase family protein [Spirosoma taeanense]|uniref:Alkaline phosphatase family protein n=1 Tax=Spirosoma taeanense TaxID=2735870 RepID=A0A6M5Y1L2_9BACT|nr:alkaline phosphatase D family protein [Spirosoma taeanense]QJW88607.1 alkaline phosphatase family protein [Spirosoma taeanense]